MALLTPEQQQRFHGIRLQMQGAARGLHDPDVAATLHLTTSQRAQLDALFSQLSTDDNRDKPTSKPSRRFSVTPTGKSRASGVARLPLLLAKRAVFDGLALDVLTAEQKEAYAKLTGDKLPIANWLAGKHEVVATHAPEPSQTTVAEPPAK
jgi:Spy/CpxP family protein refolding chaperone